jgi:hypothetical protein
VGDLWLANHKSTAGSKVSKKFGFRLFGMCTGFQFDSSLGVIWPLNKKFRELKEMIHEDQIAYEVVQIYFDDYNRTRLTEN